MKNTWKRITAALLALAVVAAMVPGQGARAAAAVTQKGCKPTSITIQWQAPDVGSGTLDGYTVYAGKDYNTIKKVATLTPDKTSYTLKKLKAGAVRTFKVTYDYTSSYGSQYTDYYVGTIYDARTTPCAVTKLKEQTWYHNTNKVYVQWKKVNSASGYQYKFFRNNGKKLDGDTITNSYTTSASSGKVSETEVFTAKVRAYAEVNGKKYYGGWSAPVYLVPQSEVTNISVKKKKVTLKLRRVTGATSYNLYVTTDQNKKGKKLKTIKATKKDKKTLTTTVKMKLNKKKTYYFYTQTIKKVKKKNYKSAIYEARYIKYM